MTREVTRREAMKTALKAGAYAAPVILAAVVPAGVSAAVPSRQGPAVSITDSNASSSTLHNGETITFVTTITNSGTATATNVKTFDNLTSSRAGLQFNFVSAVPTKGTYTPPSTGDYNAGGGSLGGGHWNIPSLLAGQSATLTLVVRLAGATGAPYPAFLFTDVSEDQLDLSNNFSQTDIFFASP